jgi:hypothetical protein
MKTHVRILSIILAILGIIGLSVPAMAATTADVTITATPTYIALTNDQSTWTLGNVLESTTYYFTADNLVAAEPLVNGDMKGTITNTGSVSEDIDIHGHNFSGTASWTLSADNTPGADEVAIRAGITGMANRAAMIQVITTSTDLKTGLAAAGTIMWCMELLTGTFTEGSAKTGVVTLTASAA